MMTSGERWSADQVLDGIDHWIDDQVVDLLAASFNPRADVHEVNRRMGGIDALRNAQKSIRDLRKQNMTNDTDDHSDDDDDVQIRLAHTENGLILVIDRAVLDRLRVDVAADRARITMPEGVALGLRDLLSHACDMRGDGK